MRRRPPRLDLELRLRRRSATPAWASLLLRVALAFALIGIALAGHWFDRDGLQDNVDGVISFADVLYFTVITGPLTPVTVAPTVPFVIVEPGCVHGPKPSPVPRIDSAKMWTSTAFCVPSGCGMAPLPM